MLEERRSVIVPKSILEAIKMGLWDFEPRELDASEFEASDAMPGTQEKLHALAERLRRGAPLWHIADRDDMEAPPPAKMKRTRVKPR